jgi:hypothetical protein
MSNCYHIECATCATESEDLGSRVNKQVVALAAEWPEIKSFLDLIDRLPSNVDMSIDLGRPNGYAFTSFMRNHGDHQLLLADENGEKCPLVVAGAPPVLNVVESTSLPDGMWVFVKNGKVVATNFAAPFGDEPLVLRYSSDSTNPLGTRRDVVSQETARLEFAEYGWAYPGGTITEYRALGPLPETYRKL